MAEPTTKNMSFLEHLEELRRRLWFAAIGIAVGVAVIVIFNDFFVYEVIMGPRNPDFWTYRFFCSLSQQLGLNDALCLPALTENLQNTSMSGAFSAYILVCITGGIAIAFPWVFYQLWLFIKPGLRQKEVNSVRGIVFFVSALFFGGILFGYFILSPLSIQFLFGFKFADTVNTPTTLSYLKIMTTLVLGTGLIFQLPILIYFLAKIGMITSVFLRKYRKHAFVVNLVLAAIITPPDVTSQILVTLPLLLLYEVSIYLTIRVEKKKAALGEL
ncbi:MAG: twin-arginine translocase subunit TatC [Flavobacteriales bacterium]|nr:twin-arginine translocase subunit TatC [Flavobacteriales bacterium]